MQQSQLLRQPSKPCYRFGETIPIRQYLTPFFNQERSLSIGSNGVDPYLFSFTDNVYGHKMVCMMEDVDRLSGLTVCLSAPARLLHNMILSVRCAHKVCPINILCKAAELPPGRGVVIKR
jgi:hypothetical protein